MMENTFLKVLYATIHKSKLSIDQIAERLCMSQPWTLYDMANPNRPSRFPAEWLVSLMKTTGDFGLLHYMARQCGFVCVRFRSFAMGRHCDLAKLNSLFGRASGVIDRMYRDGKIDKEGYDTLYSFFSEIAGHVKTAQRIAERQMELDLEKEARS